MLNYGYYYTFHSWCVNAFVASINELILNRLAVKDLKTNPSFLLLSDRRHTSLSVLSMTVNFFPGSPALCLSISLSSVCLLVLWIVFAVFQD